MPRRFGWPILRHELRPGDKVWWEFKGKIYEAEVLDDPIDGDFMGSPGRQIVKVQATHMDKSTPGWYWVDKITKQCDLCVAETICSCLSSPLRCRCSCGLCRE